MHKASKELVKLMQKTHAFIEVLDARTPHSSTNPLLADIRGKLPCIRILSKADLAEDMITKAWYQYFSKMDNSACLINGYDSPLERSDIVRVAKPLVKKLWENEPADLPRNVQLVIGGIPNAGKSTLMNQLMDRKVANTGNEPAITKGQQRVTLDEGWYLVDTPGMMWPKLEDQTCAYRLAATGTIRNTAVDAVDIAWWLAEMLIADYPDRIRERYQASHNENTAELLMDKIAKLRGCLGKGGRADLHKTSELLLNDFRSGKLGRFTLESPPP
jgi:ribosome biogenesis GTPase A